LAAIIASSMPLMVGLAGWLFLRDRLPRQAVLGLVLGFAGVALIMGARIDGGGDPLGIVLCLIGAAALTVATLSVRGASTGGNLMMIVGLQMLIGSATLAPLALAFETWSVNWSPRLVGAFLYTTLVPGLAATWVWFALVARVGAVKAATFHFLNPFFGVLIAAVLLGESLALADLLGVVIIAVGILLVQLARARPHP
jgi:drug/metabolite transporter (DMT)-like permease